MLLFQVWSNHVPPSQKWLVGLYPTLTLAINIQPFEMIFDMHMYLIQLHILSSQMLRSRSPFKVKRQRFNFSYHYQVSNPVPLALLFTIVFFIFSTTERHVYLLIS